MPKIRKKTSKRSTTRHRAKVTHKAAEQKKKTKREKKRDVTWKSKRKPDLGVPNSFLFKDQVLAEVAKEKEDAALSKTERREAQRTAAAAEALLVEQREEESLGISTLPALGADSLSSRRHAKSSGSQANGVSLNGGAEDGLEEDDEIPDLVDTQLATLQDVLDRSDLVLHVVDARDPMGYRSQWLEKLVKEGGGKAGIVLSKIDLVPRETVSAWMEALPSPVFLYASSPAYRSPPPPPTASGSSSRSTVAPPQGQAAAAGQALGVEELRGALRKWAKSVSPNSGAQTQATEPTIGLLGLPGTGKTSLLLSLLAPSSASSSGASSSKSSATPSASTLQHQAKLASQYVQLRAKHPTVPSVPASTPGAKGERLGPTTGRPVEVRVDLGEGVGVRVVDTPGFEWEEDDDDELDLGESEGEGDEKDEDQGEGEGAHAEEEEVQNVKLEMLETKVVGDLLRRNIGRVDRVKDIMPLAKYLIARSRMSDLMSAYNVPAVQEGDVLGFLRELARANGRVKKHGDADLEAGARILLRDWAHNTFPYYTAPPSSSSPSRSAASHPISSTPSADTTAHDLPTPSYASLLASLPDKKTLKRLSAKGLIRFKLNEQELEEAAGEKRRVEVNEDWTEGLGPDDEDEEDEDEEEEEDEDEDEELEEDEEEEELEQLESQDNGEEDEEDDGLTYDLAEGEELDLLSDGPEPDSGSELHDSELPTSASDAEVEEQQEQDDPEDEGEDEDEPSASLPSTAGKRKRARISDVLMPRREAKRSRPAASGGKRGASGKAREEAEREVRPIKGILKKSSVPPLTDKVSSAERVGQGVGKSDPHPAVPSSTKGKGNKKPRRA